MTLRPPLGKGKYRDSKFSHHRVSSAQSGRSIPIIADNPSDRLNGSTVELENSAVFEGSGNGSHILFISQNNSAENGGSNVAIDIKTRSAETFSYMRDMEKLFSRTILICAR